MERWSTQTIFTCKRGRKDVAHSKPKADVFIAALRALGHLPSEQAMAIGDTPYDVEAAKKINLATIALLCGGFPRGGIAGRRRLRDFSGSGGLARSILSVTARRMSCLVGEKTRGHLDFFSAQSQRDKRTNFAIPKF